MGTEIIVAVLALIGTLAGSYFSNNKNTAVINEKIKDIRVNNGTTKYIKPVYSSDEKITISNDNSELTYNYNIPKSVNAPTQKGDVLASVEVCCGESL